MRKINVDDIAWDRWDSPGGRFSASGKGISEALGREPTSTDALLRHPFDVELCRVPPGFANFPYHSHSAQWEFFHVLSGCGKVRHDGDESPIGAGDAFIFKPGEAHQIRNDGADDLVFLVVADNPIGESCYYPDSGKWLVRSPERRLMRGESLDYFDGEE